MNKYRILIFFLSLILVIGVLGAVYYFYPAKEKAKSNEQEVLNSYKLTAQLISRIITDPVIDELTETIMSGIKIMEKDKKISYLVVLNPDGKILASLKPQEVGKKFNTIYKFSMLKDLNSVTKDMGTVTEIGVPVVFRTGNKDIKVGELHMGIKKAGTGSGLPMDFLIKVGGVGALLFIIVLILTQALVFSGLQRQFAVYEREHRAMVSLDAIKKEREKVEKEIEKLNNQKLKAEQEIEKLKEEIEQKRKELEESEIGEMVKELENKKDELEKKVAELKEEEEKLREGIELKRMEQEEIKKRLDVIREKMKKIMEG